MVYKVKRFADPSSGQVPGTVSPTNTNQTQTPQEITLQEAQKTSKDLQIEGMKMQRAMMATQRMRQKLQEEERRTAIKARIQTQKIDQQKDIQTQKTQVQTKKIDQSENPSVRNWGLVKANTKVRQPIPMK